jgi:hypothetical protein
MARRSSSRRAQVEGEEVDPAKCEEESRASGVWPIKKRAKAGEIAWLTLQGDVSFSITTPYSSEDTELLYLQSSQGVSNINSPLPVDHDMAVRPSDCPATTHQPTGIHLREPPEWLSNHKLQ